MKLPPPEKIYEAWSALASGRFKSAMPPNAPAGTASVESSDAKKTYDLKWDGDTYSSTDPASWWQGYPGYPVLALMMYRQILPYDEKIATLFANVPWGEINRKAPGNYTKALENLFQDLKLPTEEERAAREQAENTWKRLAETAFTLRRPGRARNASKTD